MAVEKAYLQVLPGAGKGIKVPIQFNPQSLQVTYQSFGPTGSQNKDSKGYSQGSRANQTGSIALLSMDLLFDTTQTETNVRETTIKIVEMLRPPITPGKPANDYPLVLFHWGTFLFKGYVQSVSETIDFFSERGVPLRSTVKLGMTEVESTRGNPAVLSGIGIGASAGIGLSASAGISASASVSAGVDVGFSASASLSAGIDIGTSPLTLAQSGDSLQALAGRAGITASWKAIAAANNIDNPRLITPGTPINLNAGVGVNASAGTSASADASASAGAGVSANASAGASASFGAGA